jgi:hypothetical protein
MFTRRLSKASSSVTKRLLSKAVYPAFITSAPITEVSKTANGVRVASEVSDASSVMTCYPTNHQLHESLLFVRFRLRMVRPQLSVETLAMVELMKLMVQCQDLAITSLVGIPNPMAMAMTTQ